MLGNKEMRRGELLVAKMSMLRWMYGMTGKDDIRNEHTRSLIGCSSRRENQEMSLEN